MNSLFGIALILIFAASFGAMAVFDQFAYDSGISTHSLLFYRFCIAVLVMLPIAFFYKKENDQRERI